MKNRTETTLADFVRGAEIQDILFFAGNTGGKGTCGLSGKFMARLRAQYAAELTPLADRISQAVGRSLADSIGVAYWSKPRQLPSFCEFSSCRNDIVNAVEIDNSNRWLDSRDRQTLPAPSPAPLAVYGPFVGGLPAATIPYSDFAAPNQPTPHKRQTLQKGEERGEFNGRIVWRLSRIESPEPGQTSIRIYSRWRVGSRLLASGEVRRVSCPAVCEFTREGTVVFPPFKVSSSDCARLVGKRWTVGLRPREIAAKAESLAVLRERKEINGACRVLFPEQPIVYLTRETLAESRIQFWIRVTRQKLLESQGIFVVPQALGLLPYRPVILTDWQGQQIGRDTEKHGALRVSPLGCASAKSENQWQSLSRARSAPCASPAILAMARQITDFARQSDRDARLVRLLSRNTRNTPSHLDRIASRLRVSRRWLDEKLADVADVAARDVLGSEDVIMHVLTANGVQERVLTPRATDDWPARKIVAPTVY